MIAAVILAAGASRRMGQPKQLLLVDGEPMLARVVDAVVTAGLDQVIVVLGASAEQAQPLLAGKAITIVHNPDWPEGMASSLRIGLAAVSPQAEAALFTPADLPRLLPTTIQHIIDHYHSTGKSVIIPSYHGRRGNPVLFARSLFPELMALRGDVGGRAVFAAHPEQVAMLEVSDAGILLDIDTPDEYRAATQS